MGLRSKAQSFQNFHRSLDFGTTESHLDGLRQMVKWSVSWELWKNRSTQLWTWEQWMEGRAGHFLDVLQVHKTGNNSMNAIWNVVWQTHEEPQYPIHCTNCGDMVSRNSRGQLSSEFEEKPTTNIMPTHVEMLYFATSALANKVCPSNFSMTSVPHFTNLFRIPSSVSMDHSCELRNAVEWWRGMPTSSMMHVRSAECYQKQSLNSMTLPLSLDVGSQASLPDSSVGAWSISDWCVWWAFSLSAQNTRRHTGGNTKVT